MLKKLIFATTGIVVFAITAALILPFLVDLKHFKPAIQQVVRDSVAADVDFQSLRLTIFPHIGFRGSNLTLRNTVAPYDSDNLFTCDELDFRIEFMPLLEGKVSGQLYANAPIIRIQQTTSGSNIEALAYPTTKTTTAPTNNAAPTPEIEKLQNNVNITSIIFENALLELKQSSATDQQQTTLTDLRLKIENVGIARDMPVELDFTLDHNAQDIQLEGAVGLDAVAKVAFAQGTLEKIDGHIKLDASALRINVPEVVAKPANSRLFLDSTFRIQDNLPLGAAIDKLSLELADLPYPLPSTTEKRGETIFIDSLRVSATDLLQQKTSTLSADGRVRYEARGISVTVPIRLKSKLNLAISPETYSVVHGDASYQLYADNIGANLQEQGLDVAGQFDLTVTGQADLRDNALSKGKVFAALKSKRTQLRYQDVGTVLDGQPQIEANMRAELAENNLSHAWLAAQADLSATEIRAANLFNKQKSTPLNAEVVMETNLQTLTIHNFGLNIHTVALNSQGSISNLDTLDGDINATLAAEDLPSLAEILPGYADLLVDGYLRASASAKGQFTDLAKTTVYIDSKAELTGSDFDIDVDIHNALAPIIDFRINSNQLDLNKLLAPFASSQSTDGATDQKDAEQDEADENFALSEEEKEFLRSAILRGTANVRQLWYDDYDIRNLILAIELQELVATLNPLKMELFGGSLDADFSVDLNQDPIDWRGRFGLDRIETSELVAQVAPEHRNVLQALANFDLALSGQGTTTATVADTLSGNGKFSIIKGQLHTISVAKEIEQEFEKLAKGLSIVQSAAGSFERADQLLKSPLLKNTAAAKVNVSDYKSKYERFSNFSIKGLLTTDKWIEDTHGSVSLKDGRSHILANNNSRSGTYKSDIEVGLDGGLSGFATYTAAAKTKNKMLARSEYARLLFDRQGEFTLKMKFTGTVDDPKMKLDFGPIKDGFRQNAKNLVQQELEGDINRIKDGLLNQQKEALEQEAEALRQKALEQKRQAEAEARRQAEVAKERAEAEAARLKEEAERKAKEAADKAKEEAKKFGRGLFGR